MAVKITLKRFEMELKVRYNTSNTPCYYLYKNEIRDFCMRLTESEIENLEIGSVLTLHDGESEVDCIIVDEDKDK